MVVVKNTICGGGGNTTCGGGGNTTCGGETL